MVEEGIEPSRDFSRRLLRPVRRPFRHSTYSPSRSGAWRGLSAVWEPTPQENQRSLVILLKMCLSSSRTICRTMSVMDCVFGFLCSRFAGSGPGSGMWSALTW